MPHSEFAACVVSDVVLVWRVGIGLAANRSQVRVPATALHVTTLGKLFTHMCLCSPSSINWCWSKGGDALQLGR